MNIIKPILLVLAVFIISLITLAPARLVYYVLPENAEAQLNGLSGTVWSGRASQLSWQNKDFGRLSWKLKLRHLLKARIGGDFTLTGPDMTINGSASSNRERNVQVWDTVASMSAASLPLPENARLVTPSGRIDTTINKLSLKDNWVQSADAEIRWKNAAITQPMSVSLGEVILNVSGENGNLTGRLNSGKNSPVNLQGNINLEATGLLESNINITPDNNTPDDILDLLPLLGRPDSKGAVKVKYKGQVSL